MQLPRSASTIDIIDEFTTTLRINVIPSCTSEVHLQSNESSLSEMIVCRYNRSRRSSVCDKKIDQRSSCERIFDENNLVIFPSSSSPSLEVFPMIIKARTTFRSIHSHRTQVIIRDMLTSMEKEQVIRFTRQEGELLCCSSDNYPAMAKVVLTID